MYLTDDILMSSFFLSYLNFYSFSKLTWIFPNSKTFWATSGAIICWAVEIEY